MSVEINPSRKPAETKQERDERLIARLEDWLNNVRTRIGNTAALTEPTETQAAIAAAAAEVAAGIQTVQVLELGDPAAGPTAHRQAERSIPAGLTPEQAAAELQKFYAMHQQIGVELNDLQTKSGGRENAQLELMHTLLAELLATTERLGATVAAQAKEIAALKAELFGAEIRAEDAETNLKTLLKNKEANLSYRLAEINDLERQLTEKQAELKSALETNTDKDHIITQLRVEVVDLNDGIMGLIEQLEKERELFKKALFGHKGSLRYFRK